MASKTPAAGQRASLVAHSTNTHALPTGGDTCGYTLLLLLPRVDKNVGVKAQRPVVAVVIPIIVAIAEM